MPGRPAKKWFKRCVGGVSSKGGAYDPNAVCGAVWQRKTPKEKAALIRAENPLSPHAKLALGIGAVAALGTAAYFLFGSKPAAAATTPAPPPPKYDPNNNVAALAGSTLTIPVGTSIHFESGAGGMWMVPGPITNDATVLWTDSNVNGHFVAVGKGTAIISGTDSTAGKVATTVIVK